MGRVVVVLGVIDPGVQILLVVEEEPAEPDIFRGSREISPVGDDVFPGGIVENIAGVIDMDRQKVVLKPLEQPIERSQPVVVIVVVKDPIPTHQGPRLRDIDRHPFERQRFDIVDVVDDPRCAIGVGRLLSQNQAWTTRRSLVRANQTMVHYWPQRQADEEQDESDHGPASQDGTESSPLNGIEFPWLRSWLAHTYTMVARNNSRVKIGRTS